MSICFALPGYRRLYRSLRIYAPLTDVAARGLTYILNTANIDTCREQYPDRQYREMGWLAFMRTLSRNVRPYRTAVQLYKSLEYLLCHISTDAITEDQRDAVTLTERILGDIAARFCREYGVEIDGRESVYALCPSSLNPHPWKEPTSPLLS